MYEVKIYGEIVPFEDKWIIEQGGYCSLSEVQKQLKEADGQDVRVRISSFGGDVDTGFAIYSELRRYAKENNANIETLGEARVASIATVIFLAGDSRILTEHTDPFVHNAWTYEMGDAKTLKRVADTLERCNQKIAEHYALHTDLTVEDALELMNNETSITTQEALAMRFCTGIEEIVRPAAMKKYKQKIDNKMSDNKKGKSIYNKVLEFLKKEEGVVNKVLMSADETEIDFYELNEDDVVEVGAMANVDGSPAEGSYVMKSGETYVFVNGELTEIVPEADDTEEMESLREENAAMAEQLENLLNVSVSQAEEIKTLKAQVSAFKNAKSKPVEDNKRTPEKNSKQEQKNRAASAIEKLNTLTQKNK